MRATKRQVRLGGLALVLTGAAILAIDAIATVYTRHSGLLQPWRAIGSFGFWGGIIAIGISFSLPGPSRAEQRGRSVRGGS